LLAGVVAGDEALLLFLYGPRQRKTTFRHRRRSSLLLSFLKVVQMPLRLTSPQRLRLRHYYFRLPTLFRYSRIAGKDNLLQLADDLSGLS
jgi:hypothetical protein